MAKLESLAACGGTWNAPGNISFARSTTIDWRSTPPVGSSPIASWSRLPARSDEISSEKSTATSRSKARQFFRSAIFAWKAKWFRAEFCLATASSPHRFASKKFSSASTNSSSAKTDPLSLQLTQYRRHLNAEDREFRTRRRCFEDIRVSFHSARLLCVGNRKNGLIAIA